MEQSQKYEERTVYIARKGPHRRAIIEYNTPDGKYYGIQTLYRTKELAIAAARKELSKID